VAAGLSSLAYAYGDGLLAVFKLALVLMFVKIFLDLILDFRAILSHTKTPYLAL
jgi:hypothetical protein